MEEKKGNKSTILAVLLILAIIAIITMGLYIYRLKSEKCVEDTIASVPQTTNTMVENTIQDQDNTIDTSNDTFADTTSSSTNNVNNTSNYNANLKRSVSNALGTDNVIDLELNHYDLKGNSGYVTINNKNEAHIFLTSIEEYSNAINKKKIADNVVNVWYCEQGQAPGNAYIVFSKTDGSVTYVRFRTGDDGITSFEAQEKTLKGISNISNVVRISGSDANGIGGLGVLFVKTDGTCYPYSTLDDLAK